MESELKYMYINRDVTTVMFLHQGKRILNSSCSVTYFMLIRCGHQSIHPGRRVQERNHSGTDHVNAYVLILYIFLLKLECLHGQLHSMFDVRFRSIDDQIFDTAISLAERYDISKWEMFMSHLEWLFTDSE